MTDIHKVKDRRKVRWEIDLHPGVTFLVLLFLVGLLLVWLGLYERHYIQGEGFISYYVSSFVSYLSAWVGSIK